MRQGRGTVEWRSHKGFTLFEMVVVICSIVILYMVAEQRLNELPAAAERANFQGVLEQIKTGVNFSMFSDLASGGADSARAMESTNPMKYLLETPSNYLGEMDIVTDAMEKRSSWYFETSTNQLVYVVGGSSIEDVWVTVAAIPVNLGQIRLKIVSRYATTPQPSALGIPAVNSENIGKWQGVVLEPVYAYRWERGEEEPIELEQE